MICTMSPTTREHENTHEPRQLRLPHILVLLAIAVHFRHVPRGHTDYDRLGILDAVGHLTIEVPNEPLLVEPRDEAASLQSFIEAACALVIVATELIGAPVMAEEHVVRLGRTQTGGGCYGERNSPKGFE